MAVVEALERINRLCRQQGLAVVSAQPLTAMLHQNGDLKSTAPGVPAGFLSPTESIVLQQSALHDLHQSLQQLVADGEHSRQVNQQLMTELTDCRNSLQAEKQKTGTLAEELKQQSRLRMEINAANEELSVARLDELQRHGREAEQLKQSRDAAWARVGVVGRESEELTRRVANLHDTISVLKSQLHVSSGGKRLSDGDAGQPYVQTLGMLSSSREQVHQLQLDINGMRKDMQDCKDRSPTGERRYLVTDPGPAHASPLPSPSASVQAVSPSFQLLLVGRSPDLPDTDDTDGAVARVINTDIDSRSDVVNSTLDTDQSAWALLGEKVEFLNRSNEQLQEDLDRCKRRLQKASLEQAYLKTVCTQLSVTDHSQVADAVERLLFVVEALPTLEKFYQEVTAIVPAPPPASNADTGSDSCADSPADRGHPTRRHADWCALQWQHVVPTLRIWKEVVDKATDSKEKISRLQFYALQAVVRHLQSLFSIEQISSIAPVMNAVYLRLNETETLKKNLKDVLKLDTKCSVARVMTVVEALSHSEHCQVIVKLTLEREKLKASLDNSTELLVSFRDLMSQILSVVGVDAPSKIPQEVARLKLQVL